MLGRSIRHEWIFDESSQQKQWYIGTVVSVLSGTYGDMNAVYEVLYEGEDEAYEIVVSWTLIPHLSIFHMTEKIKIPAFSSKIIYLNIIVLHRSRFAIVN
jgi:hypothetical protein